jgi:hypothetical protein
MNTERLDKLRSDIDKINQEIEDLVKVHGTKIELCIGGVVRIGTTIKYPFIQIQRIEA